MHDVAHKLNTNVAKPTKVAIIGASGTYGKGILARAEEIGVEVVVVTRSPHKFKELKPTTTVANTRVNPPIQPVTACAKGARAAPVRPAGYAQRENR